jgi:ActR/RegA family two-component response regulator
VYDYDIILLDLNLPDMSGFEVVRSLRASKVRTPTLILSGLAGVEDKVKGFGFGADDYMTKPFHKDELVARIHAIVRRSKGHAQSVIQTDDLVVNLDTKDDRGQRRARATYRQGVPDVGAPFAAQGYNAVQRNVPQPPLWRHGRAGCQDHRRFHLQAAKKAGKRLGRQKLHRNRVGSRLRLAAPQGRRRVEDISLTLGICGIAAARETFIMTPDQARSTNRDK